MKGAQKVNEILKDEARKKDYVLYQNSDAEHKKRMNKVYVLTVVILLAAAAVLYLLIGLEGLIILAPLGIIGLAVCLLLKKKDHKKVENAWELHVKGTMLEVVRAFFPDAKYQRKAGRKKVLYHFFKANKIKCRHQIRATWKGKTFYAFDAELLKDGGEEADITLFHGQVIDIAVEKYYDMNLAAQLKKGEYSVFLPKWKKDMGELLETRRTMTKEAMSHAWLEDLAHGKCTLVCAELKGTMDSQIVEVGFSDEPNIDQGKLDMNYEDYVNRVAASMGGLETKLDKIMTNGKLFRQIGEKE